MALDGDVLRVFKEQRGARPASSVSRRLADPPPRQASASRRSAPSRAASSSASPRRAAGRRRRPSCASSSRWPPARRWSSRAAAPSSTAGSRGPDQSSVTSTSIRLLFGRIDGSRRVLEARPKSLTPSRTLRLKSCRSIRTGVRRGDGARRVARAAAGRERGRRRGRRGRGGGGDPPEGRLRRPGVLRDLQRARHVRLPEVRALRRAAREPLAVRAGRLPRPAALRCEAVRLAPRAQAQGRRRVRRRVELEAALRAARGLGAPVVRPGFSAQ